jgi:hypothetical protein
MLLNKHSQLEGRHSFLAPSKPHWLKYDDEKLDRVFHTAMAAQRGTELHAFAANAIKLGISLPQSTKTLNMYVNDGIGFRLTPEQPLFYSLNCFGTADALGFRKEVLRISDLKTGVTQSSMVQLEVYAALFCLEYRFRPFDIGMELRIYQNDEVREHTPDPIDISNIMETIKYQDKRLELLKEEALS